MKHMAAIIIATTSEKYNALLDSIEANTRQPDYLFVVNNTDDALVSRPSMLKTSFKFLDQHYPVSPNAARRVGFRNTSHADLVTVLDDNMLVSPHFFDEIRIASNRNPHACVFCPAFVPDATSSVRSVEDTFERIESPQGHCVTIRGDFARDIAAIPSTLTTFFANEWLFFWTHTLLNRPWILVKNALASFQEEGLTYDIELFDAEKEIFDTILSDL